MQSVFQKVADDLSERGLSAAEIDAVLTPVQRTLESNSDVFAALLRQTLVNDSEDAIQRLRTDVRNLIESEADIPRDVIADEELAAIILERFAENEPEIEATILDAVTTAQSRTSTAATAAIIGEWSAAD